MAEISWRASTSSLIRIWLYVYSRFRIIFTRNLIGSFEFSVERTLCRVLITFTFVLSLPSWSHFDLYRHFSTWYFSVYFSSNEIFFCFKGRRHNEMSMSEIWVKFKGDDDEWTYVLLLEWMELNCHQNMWKCVMRNNNGIRAAGKSTVQIFHSTQMRAANGKRKKVSEMVPIKQFTFFFWCAFPFHWWWDFVNIHPKSLLYIGKALRRSEYCCAIYSAPPLQRFSSGRLLSWLSKTANSSTGVANRNEFQK